MLFTSYYFIFVFLPLAWLGYQGLARVSRRVGFAWLVVASLVFYGWWDVRFVPLLLLSVAGNFLAGEAIRRSLGQPKRTRLVLTAAICANLAALGYYKYFLAVAGFLIGHGITVPHPDHVTLPLGISFFTFTQIAYLVDVAKGRSVERDPLAYGLFVTFFPHLIAGPILHHAEMMPQFTRPRQRVFSGTDLTVGISLFVLGLAKKIIIADPMSDIVASGFGHSGSVQFFAAWETALSYSIQLYFDFSGYSDMAIGLARMFGIRFPLNFNSPYKASSIQEYWRRWHMTLTRYLMEYLFDPMALSLMRRFATRRRRQGGRMTAADRRIGIVYVPAIATMLTMTIAGVWHGAGFQFVIFGVLHGIYLSICHVWRTYRLGPKTPTKLTHIGNCLLTYLCVLVGAVFFRAASVPEACRVLAGMIGAHGIEPILVPQFVVSLLSPITGVLSGHGVIVGADAMTSGPIYLRLFHLVLIYVVIWLLPNTQQIMGLYRPALGWRSTFGETRLRFHMTPRWGFAIGVVASLSVLLAQRTEFIYFQF
jgi:alginate O-acetyltransferase complex protein AlgI